MAFTITGIPGLRRRIARMMPRAMAAATVQMQREAESIATLSKEITPVDTGALRSGTSVRPLEITATTVTATIANSVPYAAYVHENLAARHREGTGAKFLEHAVMAAADGFEQRMARAIREELEKPE